MELTLDFISKMYNGRNSYAEIFSDEELKAIHIPSNLERAIRNFIEKNKLVILTGNPGDGKTHIIRYLNDFLAKKNTFIETDINEVSDYNEFLERLAASVYKGHPALIAINEYPLLELLRSMDNKFLYKDEIEEVKNHTIIYNDDCQMDNYQNKVVIIDLNNRNLLHQESIKTVLERLTKNVTLTEYNKWMNRNLLSLQHDEVVKRVVKLVSILGNIGVHAVMRDVIGFVSYILTSGHAPTDESSEEKYYYNLLFEGDNDLFDAIRKLDPSKITHPFIDEKLWNGEFEDGWLLDVPEKHPKDLEDNEEAMSEFKSLKRKFFFEHEQGIELFNLYPKELIDFLSVIRKSKDSMLEVSQRIILSINKYFDQSEEEDQKLYIWISHSYEETSDNVYISNNSIPYQNTKILVPRLPNHLEEIEYTPNHFIFSVTDKSFVSIDYEFFKLLELLRKGYPPQILHDNHKFTLRKFMANLSNETKKFPTNEYMFKNELIPESGKVIIRDNKYLLKSR
ncbi:MULTISPECIES: hypothetical protein [Bhargavaea]|uniref:Novel STAND NTPase 3 domain-containing protein n=1 Tax=Bhargavaea changchunensis TaxID=2134037 RepID=A0ABW2NG40_9BACL|nr:hypothetical protein [Bhargavaea sp. CC-171006]